MDYVFIQLNEMCKDNFKGKLVLIQHTGYAIL